MDFYILVFADDTMLVSETKEGLQQLLFKLESFCHTWNLTVNVAKTEVIVFRKAGR